MQPESHADECALPLERIACPACGEREHREVVRRVDGLTIVRCRCGLAFVNPRATAEAIPALYRDYYRGVKGTTTGYVAYAPTIDDLRSSYPWGWEFITANAALRGARTLDVGCAYGKMVYWMRRAGAKATGIDMLSDGVLWGRNYGLDLREGTVESLDDSEQYDVVTLMDVIEHVFDLSGFMAKLRRIVKPSGLVMVQTPNFGSCRGPRSIHLHQSLEHLLYFEASSLDKLFRQYGFGPIKATKTYCVVPTEILEPPPPRRVARLVTALKRLPLLVEANRFRRRFFPRGNRYVEDRSNAPGSTILGMYRKIASMEETVRSAPTARQ